MKKIVVKKKQYLQEYQKRWRSRKTEEVEEKTEEVEEKTEEVEESDCYVKKDENGNWNATIVPVKEEVEITKIKETTEVRLDISEDPGVYTITNYVTDEECEHEELQYQI